MLDNLKLEDILIFDIETVPSMSEYNQMREPEKKLWDKKSEKISKDGKTAEETYERAGIYAEFGKIICISGGLFDTTKASGTIGFRLKSFYEQEEKNLLLEFIELLNLHYNDISKHILCGHNIKEFDIPYVCRRILINRLKLPRILDLGGLKPWEVPHLDTMQLWKFGDYKSFTSLALLASVFDIPTPKDDMDGSEVADVYWKDNNLERIVKYCQKDVITVAQLILKFKGMPLLEESEIVYA